MSFLSGKGHEKCSSVTGNASTHIIGLPISFLFFFFLGWGVGGGCHYD